MGALATVIAHQRTRITRIGSAAAFGAVLMGLMTLNGHADGKAAFDLGKLPDGYKTQGPEAPGQYSTMMSPGATKLQRQLELLERKVLGLSRVSAKDQVLQAERVYYLEHVALYLQLAIANAPASEVSGWEREVLLFHTARTYGLIRQHGERLYEDMLRFIDVALPGGAGAQFRKEDPKAIESIYYPNFRATTQLPPAQAQAEYERRRDEFVSKGGSLSEVTRLTRESLRQMGAVTRVEYVMRADESIWVTEGNAGHVLLAEGQPVLGAGQIVILKDRAGQVVLTVVSNASGNFRPDLSSAALVADAMAELTPISPNLVIYTKGEPIGIQTAKIYLKGRKTAPEEASAFLKKMEKTAREILSGSVNFRDAEISCEAALLNAS